MNLPKCIVVLLLVFPWNTLANINKPHDDNRSRNDIVSVENIGKSRDLADMKIHLVDNDQTVRTLFTFGGTFENSIGDSVVADGPIYKIECMSANNNLPHCQEKTMTYSGDVALQSALTASKNSKSIHWTPTFPYPTKQNGGMECPSNQIVAQLNCSGNVHHCETMRLGCHEMPGYTFGPSVLQNNVFFTHPIPTLNKATCPENSYITGVKCMGAGEIGSSDDTSCEVLDIYCSALTSSEGATPDNSPVPPADNSPLPPAPCVGASCGGDPHFTTFNGFFFSFHGQCDLLLMKSARMGLEVHIRTKRIRNYSYISGAAIKIEGEVLEVQPDGQIAINNNRVPSDILEIVEGKKFASHKLKSKRTGKKKNIVHYELDLGSDKIIKIRFNSKTEMMFVDMEGEFSDSVGLLGSPEGKGALARNGMLDLKGEWNAYGEEWQINDSDSKLFFENSAPQYPVGCVYEQTPAAAKNLRRRLMENPSDAVSFERASSVCTTEHDHKREFCIEDVMATGDLDLADDPFYN